MAPDPILRAVAACSYRASTDAGARRQESALELARSHGIAGRDLVHCIRRHRIQALALDTLQRHGASDLLGDALGELRDEASQVRLAALAGFATESRILKLLRDSGIECLPLKGGPRLSLQLYGDIGLRHSKDLDLVVRSDRFVEALDALQAAGWIPKHPVWTSSRGHRWLAARVLRDFPLFDPVAGVEVEIHHRFERIASPDMDSLWWEEYSRRSDHRVSDAEFCYLCLHGALHGWSRLKWLGDLVAVLERRPAVFLEARPLAHRLGLVPALDQVAGLLAVFHGIQPPGCDARPAGPANPDRGVKFCLSMVAGPDSGAASRWRRASDRIRLDLHRQTMFGARAPIRNRILHVFWSVAIRPEDIESLGNAPLWPLWLPLVRLASVLGRYLGLPVFGRA